MFPYISQNSFQWAICNGYEFVTVHPGTDQITTECHGSLSVQDSREGELLLNK